MEDTFAYGAHIECVVFSRIVCMWNVMYNVQSAWHMFALQRELNLSVHVAYIIHDGRHVVRGVCESSGIWYVSIVWFFLSSFCVLWTQSSGK